MYTPIHSILHVWCRDSCSLTKSIFLVVCSLSYVAFMSVVMMHHKHSNPVWTVAAEQMLQSESRSILQPGKRTKISPNTQTSHDKVQPLASSSASSSSSSSSSATSSTTTPPHTVVVPLPHTVCSPISESHQSDSTANQNAGSNQYMGRERQNEAHSRACKRWHIGYSLVMNPELRKARVHEKKI